MSELQEESEPSHSDDEGPALSHRSQQAALAKVATHLKELDKIEEVSEEHYESAAGTKQRILPFENYFSKGEVHKVHPEGPREY